jgi:hypothetical protein
VSRSTATPAPRPLRLMVFDTTCRGLSASWWTGARLYGALGRLDASHGAARWDDALDWLATVSPGALIQEIQYWGHGNWGCALMNRERLDGSALEPAHRLYPKLRAIRERLAPGGQALWWFRTCETFGAKEGHAFARAWTRFFGCRAAGHTYVIHPLQSGLHSLGPGEEPRWPEDEGLAFDRHGRRRRTALWSTLAAPNTITCFHSEIPDGF